MAQARITAIIDRYENKLKAANPRQIRGLANDMWREMMAEYAVANLRAEQAREQYLSGKD